MGKEEAKKRVLEECASGQKSTALALVLVKKYPLSFQDIDLVDLLEEMVKEGSLIEVEYVLPDPSVSHMAKSFYLPKGTAVTIINFST